MGLDGLEAQFEAHKLPILAGAGAVVVGLALVRRRKGTAAAPAAESASAGGQVAGASGANAYDSTSSDVYGLIQPQLESFGGQLTALQDKLNKVPVNPAPPHGTGLIPTPPHGTGLIPTPAPPGERIAWHPAAPKQTHPIPVTRPKQAAGTWVTVNKGDTLSGIAARYPSPSITSASIYNLNRSTIGKNPNLIKPGEKLRIG